MALCSDLGDELETHIMQLEADSVSVDDEWAVDASKWMTDPDLSLLAGPDPFCSAAINTPLNGFDAGLDSTLFGITAPTASLLTNSELDELTRASRRALIMAAKRNRLSVSMYGMPAQTGAWQGCTHSPWCNGQENHPGPCNAKATTPGVAAYASLMEAMNEVDDTGAVLVADDMTAPGQADSSAAGSGKHGSTATHHEEAENSSPAGATAQLMAARGGDSALPRSLSTGNLPGTARAHAITSSAFIPTKSEIDMDTGVTPGWMNSHTSNHPLSNHCPGATNIELLEAPDDATGQQQPMTAEDRAATTQNSLPRLEEHRRMADVGNINASWVVQGSGGTAGACTPLPSSFMIVNDNNTCWTDTSSGLSGGLHDGLSMAAWSSAATNHGSHDGHQHPRSSSRPQQDGEEDRTGARRALRATRSLPNFRHMVNGTSGPTSNPGNAPIHIPTRPASAAPPAMEMPSSAGGATNNSNNPVRRVIIHRWPSSNSGPTMARKSRAAEELARSNGQYGGGKAGALQVSASCHSSGTSLTDLASPHSSGPSSTLTTGPQRLLSGEVTDDMNAHAGGADASGAAAPSQAARHNHNLRGRTQQSHAAVSEGGGGGWLQQSSTNTNNNGVRTSRLPEVPPPQTHNGKKRGASGGPGSTCARPVPHPCGHVCTACGTSVTPVWRAGPQGPKTLCNACGVRYMKVAKKK